MNRSFDNFRREANGVEPERGTPRSDPSGARANSPEPLGDRGWEYETAERGERSFRSTAAARSGVPPTTYGNVPYDSWRLSGHDEPWRGRDEEHDFWGQDRHADRYEHPSLHPSLWTRVKGVFTGLGPKNYARSDERIREDVCEHLYYHPYVDASEIEVLVRDGEVTLTGTVDARMAKRAAEDCADRVRGVKDVHNHLRVKPGEAPAAREGTPPLER